MRRAIIRHPECHGWAQSKIGWVLNISMILIVRRLGSKFCISLLSNPVATTPTPGDNSTMRGEEEMTVEDFTRTQGITLWHSDPGEDQCGQISYLTLTSMFSNKYNTTHFLPKCGGVWLTRCVCAILVCHSVIIIPQYWCWLRSQSSVLLLLCRDGVMMKCCHPRVSS